MATITDVRLRVTRKAVGVDIEIDADVSFDAFDVAADQVFQLSWTLLGPDACAGDGGLDVGLDLGTDVRLDLGTDVRTGGAGSAGGTVMDRRPGEPIRCAAEGRPTRTHHLRASIPAGVLDEIRCGEDEIRALVTLAPIGPFGDSRESNRVRLPAP